MGVTWSPVNESVNYGEGRGEGVLIRSKMPTRGVAVS